MARPREFEPQEALKKAMLQFWRKGYHDTSIRDLVDCTGVNYYGLYAEFENKHGLFLAALDLYRESVTADVARELRQPGPAVAGVKRAFDRLIAFMTTSAGRVGCMMCNTAVELAPYDSDAAVKVQAHMTLLREAFAARLAAGQKTGEIASDTDVAGLSEFLATTAYSAGLLIRAGQDDAYVRRHIGNALAAVR